ncbi:unnamed protein product [Tuber aestivum]|uniref:Rhodopsin domain-containing protein n=1 Tax=Tuber aestivum TaxID=59557 RepID=A0A292PVQ3_9PEZI|nr:unnamed protein product [Tuber aestivum]
MSSNPLETGSDFAIQNKGPWGTTTATILLSVTGVVVVARMYSRAIIMRFVGGDDYCILCAMATAIALTILLCKSAEYGAGKHVAELPKDNVLQIIKIGYSMQILYVVVMTFTKASLLLLLIRLVQNRGMSIVVWSIFGFMGAFAMASFWASVFHCTPPSYAWEQMDRESLEGSCGNLKAQQYWVPAGSIVMDFILWLLPLKLIYPLKLPRAQKIGLYMVFILGAMVFISASVRISLILALSTFGPNTEDPTWTTYQINLWSIVEATVGIICSSLPTLRPLFKRHFPFVFDLLSRVFDGRDGTWNQSSFRTSAPVMEIAAHSPSKWPFPFRSPLDSAFSSTDLFPDPNASAQGLDIDLEASIESCSEKGSRSIMLEMDIADVVLDQGSGSMSILSVYRTRRFFSIVQLSRHLRRLYFASHGFQCIEH